MHEWWGKEGLEGLDHPLRLANDVSGVSDVQMMKMSAMMHHLLLAQPEQGWDSTTRSLLALPLPNRWRDLHC